METSGKSLTEVLSGSDRQLILNSDFGFSSVHVCAVRAAHFADGKTEAPKFHEKVVVDASLEHSTLDKECSSPWAPAGSL